MSVSEFLQPAADTPVDVATGTISAEERQTILDKHNSPAEEQAKKRNWLPEELYTGPEGGFSSAEVFNVRGEFIGKDRERMKQISGLQNQMETLTQLYKTATEHGKEQALKELRKQKANAITDADGDRVTEIEAQMVEVSKESNVDKLLDTTTTAPQEQKLSPYFTDTWLPSNPWYNKDMELTDLANTIGKGFASNNQQATDSELFAYVDKAMQAHLQQPTSNVTTAVTTTPRRTTRVQTKAGQVTEADLSYKERTTGIALVHRGTFKDLNEYAEALAKSSK